MNETFSRVVGEFLLQQQTKEERATLCQRVIAFLGALCLVVLLALAATWPTKALAAKATSAEECMLLADYGVTTRALTLAGIDLPKRLEVLGMMYRIGEDRIAELVKIVRQASDKSALPANDFAGQVYQTCLRRAGDISGLLGPDA